MPSLSGEILTLFNGQNVTEFIRKYERICRRHRVPIDEKVEILKEYYIKEIGAYLRKLPTVRRRDQDSIVQSLKEEYTEYNSHRLMGTVQALKGYASETAKRTTLDLKAYIQKFHYLVSNAEDIGNVLEDLTKADIFVRSLPITIRMRVIRKCGLQPIDRTIQNFRKVLQFVKEMAGKETAAIYQNAPTKVATKARKLITTTPAPIPILLGRSALSEQAKSLKATLLQAIATRDQELEDVIWNLQTLKLSAVTLHGIIEGSVTFARYSPIQLTTILSRVAYIELYNATARSSAQQTIVPLSLLPSRQVQAART